MTFELTVEGASTSHGVCRIPISPCDQDGPNHQTLVLQPSGAARSALYRADLRVAARRTDAATDNDIFVCAEMVRQTILIVPGENAAQKTPRPPTVKEVETICTYQRRPDGSLVGYQRTATFLVPAWTARMLFAKEPKSLPASAK